MKNVIQRRFRHDDSQRREILERARLCAALTKPWILPPQEQDKNRKLPENHQSLGSRGVTNLEGRMLMALYPPGTPWFEFVLTPEVLYDPRVPPEWIQQFQQHLYLREMQVQATLESAHLKSKDNRSASGFRSNKRKSLSQILITGDVLEQLTDDYRIKVFGRTEYVTKRDSTSDVLYHIIREKIDPLSLSDEKLAACEFDQDIYEAESASDRMQDLFTLCEWQPQSKLWLIQQECNGQIINESEEKVSPFFSTAYELAPGEDYGRGLIELNLGDLRSHNELRQRLKEFAGTHSKQTPVIDYGSEVQEEDFQRESGEPIRARVQSGQATDIGWFGPTNQANFQVVQMTDQVIEQGLAGAMLLESAIQPEGERVTARQIERIAMEVEGALGGVYAPIAEEQQVPLLRRLVYQMERDDLMPSLPEDVVEVRALTGINALQREVERSKVMSLTQIVAQLGEPGMAKIDIGVLVDVLARYGGVHEPGLIKSNEQLAQEQQQAMQQQTQMAAAQQAIQSTGNIAEKSAEAALAAGEE